MSEFDYGFEAEQEELTQEEKTRLEAIEKEFTKVESQLTFALRELRPEDSKRLEIKKLTLRGDDLRAFTILQYRLIHSGLMSKSDFLMEVFRRGMKGLMDHEHGNAVFSAVMAATLSGLHPEMSRQISSKLIKKGLAEIEKHRKSSLMDAMMEESFEVKETK